MNPFAPPLSSDELLEMQQRLALQCPLTGINTEIQMDQDDPCAPKEDMLPHNLRRDAYSHHANNFIHGRLKEIEPPAPRVKRKYTKRKDKTNP